MSTAPPGEEAAPFGKVKVKVQAEFWIDPLDHVPLAERRAMLLAGGQRESPGNFPMCGVHAARGQVTSRLLLEVFISELARALKPLSMHGRQAQIVTESSSQYNFKDGAVAVNFEPAQMSSHMAVNFEDRHSFEDCRSEDSQPNVCERSHVVPCFGLKGCSSGRREAGVGCDDVVLSSPDHIIRVKVEPPDASVHRSASIPHERTTEAEQEEIDHVSLHEHCKSSPFSSIAGGCSQVDVSHEPSTLYSSFTEGRNATTTHGRRTPISSSQAAYQEDLSSHAQVFSYPENVTREHCADNLNDGNNDFGMEFPLKKYVVNSSEVNTTEHVCTSLNDTPESSIASLPCMGVKLSSTGVNNEYHASLGESNLQRDERCNDINLDRAGGAGNIAAVAGLQEQSSLKANKPLSDSSLSTDPVRMKHKFSDMCCLSEESPAKRICTSISVYPKSRTRKGVNEVLSHPCMDNCSSGTGNLAVKGQTPTMCQKEKQLKTGCLLRSSFLSTSTVMMKVEPADEAADSQFSEPDALGESCFLDPSPNTQTTQAFVCQDNIPFVVRYLQENHDHGGTCSQETSINHFKEPLLSDTHKKIGIKSQPCVAALPLPHLGVRAEATEENSHNQVLSANVASSLCGSLLGYQEGTAIRSRDDLSVQNCYDQAPEANERNRVYTSVFDSQENSLPVSPYTVAEVLSKDVSYKQNISSANNLQASQQCTMFIYRMPEDVSVAVKEKSCTDIGNQGLDGTVLLSPGRVKVEPLEEVCAICSSETATATKFSTSTFDSSSKFEVDHLQATLCGTCDMQTIREGDTMCTDKMSANLPVGGNLRDALPDSLLYASPQMVKMESLEGNHIGSISETETTVNFSSSTFESSEKAVSMNACTGTPVREDQCIHWGMTDLLPDSALSTFPVRVKLPHDHVFRDSESMTRKDSRLSTFNSPIHAIGLNPLPDILSSSKAINCQADSPSRVSNVLNNQETILSSPHINIPEDTGIVAGQEQACMANHCIGLDVPASKGSDNVEQLEERCANIVHEDTPGILNGLYSSSNLIPKLDPVESSIQNLCINPLGGFPSSGMPLVEAKREIDAAPSVDMLDHMPLTERTKMLASSMVSELKPARKSRCFKQTRVHAVGCDSVGSLKVKTKCSTHQRKRKKTATDSVEIALEEDAPGLLQGLLDRGINPDEIKLYGCEDDVDALDISSHEDSFEDLEAVLSKLFSERPTSLFKLAPLRTAKGTKPVYCLACLISLIEQTRYLQFRNCPVEWGWCRDLQSFIFVFKMHNRIVLERPEYGYATYFFELVEYFPIDWQIKRLVTAMKLTCCSRATLIENKPLLVGEDLSEGEARVLVEYGWLPNTGLGSMLNYCDRVVHDRHERDTSEWRLKIGKLLMDGFDGGRIVSADLPKKVEDYAGNHNPEIKMET